MARDYKLHIDISDLCAFSAKSSQVSGIQRVVLCVIGQILRDDALGRNVEIVFYHPYLKRFYAMEKSQFMQTEAFNPKAFNKSLGGIRYARFHMGKYRNKPAKRLFHGLHNKVTFAKSWLTSQIRKGPALLHPVTFGKNDRYLFMGAGWDVPGLTDIVAKAAAETGMKPWHMVHDLIPLYAESKDIPLDKGRFRSWLNGVTDRCDHFLTYSRATRRDLEQFLAKEGKSTKSVSVIPLAHEFMCHPPQAVRDQVVELGHTEYVLFVGPIQGRKNGRKLIEAWSRLVREVPAEQLPTLVLAGNHRKCSWLINEIEAGQPGLKDHLVFVDGPNDTELEMLYRQCLFSAFPSAYEGWGLPVGESIWFGRMCVAANNSSLPEVAGDWVDYCDLEEPESLYLALHKLISDRDYLAQRTSALASMHMRRWHDVAVDIVKAVSQD